MKHTFSILVMTALLSGCVGVQNDAVRDLSYTQARQLIPIGASQDRVREVFGNPRTINSRNGEEIWGYVDQDFDWGKAFNPFESTLRAVDTKGFIIMFDRNKRVKSIDQNTFNL